MQSVKILLTEEGVNEYLTEHGLMYGATPLEAVLLQIQGTESGQPCVILIATVDGKKRVIKTTLDTMIASTGALRSAAEALGWTQPH